MNNKYSTVVGLHGTPARCTLQFVRRCYGLRGIYGRFDSKIRFEIESDGRFDSRFDSNAKKRFAGPYCIYLLINYYLHAELKLKGNQLTDAKNQATGH